MIDANASNIEIALIGFAIFVVVLAPLILLCLIYRVVRRRYRRAVEVQSFFDVIRGIDTSTLLGGLPLVSAAFWLSSTTMS